MNRLLLAKEWYARVRSQIVDIGFRRSLELVVLFLPAFLLLCAGLTSIVAPGFLLMILGLFFASLGMLFFLGALRFLALRRQVLGLLSQIKGPVVIQGMTGKQTDLNVAMADLVEVTKRDIFH